jgi:hypothetical protein
MDTTDTRTEVSTQRGRAATKFGLGLFLCSVGALLIIAATILIWFGIFPGLVAIAVAIPLGIVGGRLMRTGKPATMARDR